MMRSRFLLFIIIPLIFFGLLVFSHPNMPGRFLRIRLFHGVSLAIKPLNNLRMWMNGGDVLLPENNNRQSDVDKEEKLMAAYSTIEVLTQENNRLRSVLGFKDKNNIHVKGVDIVYYGREFGKEYILIDRGINGNMQKGDMVINANGLFVGTIKDMEDSFAKVGIAANKEEVFDVEILPSGVKAFAKGLNGRAFSLELVAQNAAVRRGDYIIIKGGQFSFLLGEVVRVATEGAGTFKEIRGIFLAHPDLEKEVFVVGH